MTALVWDETGKKRYESGVDHGVLYINNVGVAWNGITSIEDSNTDEVSPVHIDGFLIRNLFSIGDLEGTLKAYTYPDEFLPCDGLQRYGGMYIDDQPPLEFSLTYRSYVGNDIQGSEGSYKIHLLYNLTAVADTKTYQTFSLTPEPMEFSWTIYGRPEEAQGYRPTAHFIVDSSLWPADKLSAFEDILYGSASSPPTIPSFADLLMIMDLNNEMTIVEYPNDEWMAFDLLSKYVHPMTDELFEITAPTVTMIDADTFEVSTYNTTSP
jgi:hypothetical protein